MREIEINAGGCKAMRKYYWWQGRKIVSERIMKSIWAEEILDDETKLSFDE